MIRYRVTVANMFGLRNTQSGIKSKREASRGGCALHGNCTNNGEMEISGRCLVCATGAAVEALIHKSTETENTALLSSNAATVRHKSAGD